MAVLTKKVKGLLNGAKGELLRGEKSYISNRKGRDEGAEQISIDKNV